MDEGIAETPLLHEWSAAEGHDEPWPDDLRPQEIVRLLRERSRVAIAALEEEGDTSF